MSASPPTDLESTPKIRYKSLLGLWINEWIVKITLTLCAKFSIIITFTIVAVLLIETGAFFVRASHEWEKNSPDRIEFATKAIARGEAQVEQSKLDLAAAEAAADAPLPTETASPGEFDESNVAEFDRDGSGELDAAEVAAARAKLRQRQIQKLRTDLASQQRTLKFERENLENWEWKNKHATAGGVFQKFIGSTKWSPRESQDYGVWSLISGTLSVAFIAMIVALPLGLVTAIYLSEYAPRRVRSTLKPTLEILAGIPTVVYGYFALRIITPGLIDAHGGINDLLRFITAGFIDIHSGFNGFNALSAGVMVGVLCLPIVTSLTEDALQAVPRSLRDAAYGLGSTRFDVSTKVVVPAALSGIVSAFLLAIARAVGETMIVALAAGATPKMTFDPRLETQTMTGYMVQVMGGDAPHGTPEYSSLYAVAAVLFVMTLSLTLFGNYVRRRFREAYA